MKRRSSARNWSFVLVTPKIQFFKFPLAALAVPRLEKPKQLKPCHQLQQLYATLLAERDQQKIQDSGHGSLARRLQPP